ncbi:sulfite exporter TauE/SafE family protein [Arenimonas sp.]|uniref:sulfite exporter TauE/SafE family protein n=1 Tax=Arenimonas sp. TaxID=1872635 RepID=UPI0025B850C9|nr:sulfite exporter TauE/SafE family protein [Arenimonas sp.]
MSLAWAVYLALGAVAGVLAGMLGIGGGLVLVAALVWLLPSQGVPAQYAVHVALATALASIVLTGLSSARAHHRRGSVLWATAAWLVPGMLLGGWLGSLVATRLDGDWLRAFIAVYCYLAAVQLGLDWPRARPERPDAPVGPGYTAAGGFVGALSALVGIGGGSMTVPLLVWRGVRPVRAVGTSSACGVAIALASAAGYAAHGPAAGVLPAGSWGYVFLPAAIGIAIASVLTAPLGTTIAHRISGLALRRLFAGFLLLVGTSLWWGP